MFDIDGYKQEITEDILGCLETMGVQPILFIGSGLSARYFNAPNWIQLLEKLKMDMPKLAKQILKTLKDNSIITNKERER